LIVNDVNTYSARSREWVESYPEYQFALKRGKITKALEIAAVILSDMFKSHERKRDIDRIMKKEFPEISNQGTTNFWVHLTTKPSHEWLGYSQ